MTSKDMKDTKDELAEDLEATDEEAENVKGGVMFRPKVADRPDRPDRPRTRFRPGSHA